MQDDGTFARHGGHGAFDAGPLPGRQAKAAQRTRRSHLGQQYRRRQTFGDVRAVNPGCKRPRLKHDQHSIRRALSYCLGGRLWMREARAAPNRLRHCRTEIDVSFNETSTPAYWSMAVLLERPLLTHPVAKQDLGPQEGSHGHARVAQMRVEWKKRYPAGSVRLRHIRSARAQPAGAKS